MLIVFLKVLAIFCMVVIGYVANKKDVLPIESNKYLVNLLLEITTPCMIFGSMASNSLSSETLKTTIQVALGTVVFFLVSWGFAVIVVKLLKYRPRMDQGVLIVIMTGVNTGFMGFPITKAIFGNEYLFYMVIENCLLTFYLYFLAVIQMNYGYKKKSSIKEIFRPLCNMCMLAAVVGAVVLIGDIRLPSIVMDFFNTIGDATVPISMIVVGVQLGNSDLKGILSNGKLIIASVVNVAVIPALTLLAVNWLPLTNKAKLILVFAAAFPCAVATVAVAAKEKKNADLMAEGVAFTTLLSMATLPVVAVVLMGLYL
ncbi:AEC family transporter [Aminicella lysinilytica]|jgi:predicted permease|uniref:Putative permease n=1 Tax=Aminicella lysinilytica TaxID=433323 RepID=A0A4R6QBQ3_9FIRM|nr:AEC family transporter [Aminicella lysinilytica]NLD10975.1 AEC family transporter [Clostridiales bacterium]TDP59811.1 putative permease [Aminicella lysinilytica]